MFNSDIFLKNVINFRREWTLAPNYDSIICQNGLGESTVDEKGILLVDAGQANDGLPLAIT